MLDSKFFLVCLAITTNVGRWDYTTIVNSLKESGKRILATQYQKIVDGCHVGLSWDGLFAQSVSDNCEEIADGCMDTWSEDVDRQEEFYIHVNCYMHLIICNLTKKGECTQKSCAVCRC